MSDTTTPIIEINTERARQMISDFLTEADDLTPTVITNPGYGSLMSRLGVTEDELTDGDL